MINLLGVCILIYIAILTGDTFAKGQYFNGTLFIFFGWIMSLLITTNKKLLSFLVKSNWF